LITRVVSSGVALRDGNHWHAIPVQQAAPAPPVRDRWIDLGYPVLAASVWVGEAVGCEAAVFWTAMRNSASRPSTSTKSREHEVLVRLAATGICHSDLAVMDGALTLPTPIVLGHERSGVVEAVGSCVTRVTPGDHVVLRFASCGRCLSCLTGHPVYCDQSAAMNTSGTRMDGTTAYMRRDGPLYGHFVGVSSFTSVALVHERSAVVMAGRHPLELLAPPGCGVQTGAGTVMNLFRPGYGNSLAVTGAGSVGLSAVMAAVVVGCECIVAVDVPEDRLALARELGATHTINTLAEDLDEQMLDVTRGRGIDLAPRPDWAEQRRSSGLRWPGGRGPPEV
jgi:Zn-dependent alcohol dehydrogenase